MVLSPGGVARVPVAAGVSAPTARPRLLVRRPSPKLGDAAGRARRDARQDVLDVVLARSAASSRPALAYMDNATPFYGRPVLTANHIRSQPPPRGTEPRLTRALASALDQLAAPTNGTQLGRILTAGLEDTTSKNDADGPLCYIPVFP